MEFTDCVLLVQNVSKHDLHMIYRGLLLCETDNYSEKCWHTISPHNIILLVLIKVEVNSFNNCVLGDNPVA